MTKMGVCGFASAPALSFESSCAALAGQEPPAAARGHPAMLGPVIPCPDCGRALTFVASRSHRGLWGYTQVQTYECSAHGPFFVTPGAIADTESGGLGAFGIPPGNPDLDHAFRRG
jgi:hypothetical protein